MSRNLAEIIKAEQTDIKKKVACGKDEGSQIGEVITMTANSLLY